MILMAYAENISRNAFRADQGEGEYLNIDPDTVDLGREFRAVATSVNNGEKWRLWSAPDNRPVAERKILGQRVGVGTEPIHSVLLL